jgi:hypothetical protein
MNALLVFALGCWGGGGRPTRLDDRAAWLYLLPAGFATHHVHAWKRLLEQAGFRLARRSQGNWEAFCAFWCDQVQPAVRRALGRDDVHAGI